MSDPRHSQNPSRTSTPKSSTRTLDPEGEEAYQLAFHDAAKMNPPRIPNPLAYPRSPSAQAYLKSRTARQPQSSNRRVENSMYVDPPEDVHSRRRASKRPEMSLDEPKQHSKSVSPSIKQEPHGHQRESHSQIRAPPHQHQPQGLPSMPYREAHHQQGSMPTSEQHQRPPDQWYGGGHTLEPQMQAPSGPRNPFERGR